MPPPDYASTTSCSSDRPGSSTISPSNTNWSSGWNAITNELSSGGIRSGTEVVRTETVTVTVALGGSSSLLSATSPSSVFTAQSVTAQAGSAESTTSSSTVSIDNSSTSSSTHNASPSQIGGAVAGTFAGILALGICGLTLQRQLRRRRRTKKVKEKADGAAGAAVGLRREMGVQT
ncbi:hypothetical protein T439DRAFT_356454 [Meredithblackwellia eburnea MCA 4105]